VTTRNTRARPSRAVPGGEQTGGSSRAGCHGIRLSDPLAKRRAAVTVTVTVTVNLIRCAKALCGKEVRPFIEQAVPLPRPVPFDGVMMEKDPSMRYVSRIDAFAILAKAKEELQESDPESFKRGWRP